MRYVPHMRRFATPLCLVSFRLVPTALRTDRHRADSSALPIETGLRWLFSLNCGRWAAARRLAVAWVHPNHNSRARVSRDAAELSSIAGTWTHEIAHSHRSFW